MRQAILLAFVAAGMVSLAVGCGDAANADLKPIKELVVGNWAVEPVMDAKNAKKKDLEMFEKQKSQMKLSMEFKADGTTAKTMKMGDFTPPADSASGRSWTSRERRSR